MDVRREAGDEDAALPRRDDLPERLAHDPLRTREAWALGVRRVAEQEIDAAVSELGQPTDVRLQAVDGRVVELPVAGMEHTPRGGLDREPDRVRHRMGHADELDAERPQVERAGLGFDLPQLRGAKQAVLVELRLDEAERQPRRPDLRDAHLAHQVRQRAHVILVRVSQHHRTHRAVVQVTEVREDHVDAEVLVARERHAGVDDDALVVELVDGHVLPDLPQPAEGDHTQYIVHRGLSLGRDQEAEPFQASAHLRHLVLCGVDERQAMPSHRVPEQP